MKPEVVAEGLQFPEGPAFDSEGNLYVVEIMGGQVSRIRPDGRLEVFAHTGGGPNGSQFGPDGLLYVCNNGGFDGAGPGRVERITPDGEVERWITEADGAPLHRPNDLVFDEDGNLYFTDPIWGTGSAPIEDSPPGHICFATPEGAVHRLHTGLGFPNGIALSPDGRSLVVCESATGKLHAFPVETPGRLGPGRVFCDLGAGSVPDGFAFDAEGFVLCCGHGTGRLQVFAPEGGPKQTEFVFEDPGITNICFGGPEFRTLFVTESRAGRVVRVDWERPGLRLFPDRKSASP
jgi:gluconolactonase